MKQVLKKICIFAIMPAAIITFVQTSFADSFEFKCPPDNKWTGFKGQREVKECDVGGYKIKSGKKADIAYNGGQVDVHIRRDNSRPDAFGVVQKIKGKYQLHWNKTPDFSAFKHVEWVNPKHAEIVFKCPGDKKGSGRWLRKCIVNNTQISPGNTQKVRIDFGSNYVELDRKGGRPDWHGMIYFKSGNKPAIHWYKKHAGEKFRSHSQWISYKGKWYND